MADYSIPELSYIASILSIPANYLQWPEFITMLIIPAILMCYALYNFLNERVGPFRGHSAVNLILGIVLTFTTLRYSSITLWISVGYILIFKIHSISWKLTFALIVASVYFSLSLLIFAVWAFTMSVVLMRMGRTNRVLYGIVAVIVTVAFFYAYSYLSPYIPSFAQILSGEAFTGNLQ
ncbi:MAG: hypothetical protein V1944_00355 [Candidatus Aenigmatarchaeota archaeon]